MRTENVSINICNSELGYKGDVRFVGQYREDGRLFCIRLPKSGEVIVDDLTMDMLIEDFEGDIPPKVLNSIVNYYVGLLPPREVRHLLG